MICHSHSSPMLHAHNEGPVRYILCDMVVEWVVIPAIVVCKGVITFTRNYTSVYIYGWCWYVNAVLSANYFGGCWCIQLEKRWSEDPEVFKMRDRLHHAAGLKQSIYGYWQTDPVTHVKHHPAPKSGNQISPNGYRGIQLLCIMDK